MTPEWKLLINFCPKSAFQPRFTYYGQIWRKSAVAKLPKSHLVLLIKNPGVGDTFEPPFCHHLTDRAQNFVNFVGRWPVYVYRLWSGSAAVCRTYSGKSPKKWIQYRLSAYNNNSKKMFMVLSSWQSHCSSAGSFDERRTALNGRQPKTKPVSPPVQLPESTPTIAIYYYYSSWMLILILPSHGG